MAETVFFGETDVREFVPLSAEETIRFQLIAEGVGPLSVGATEFGITAGPAEDDEKVEEILQEEGEGPRGR